jgi:pimeloyl-ACP methyl ester carboxylesterase
MGMSPFSFAMEKKFEKILNGRNPVYYQFIDKKAKETVVFIHGLFSTSSIFRHFLGLMEKNVILVELRGIVYSKCERPFLENYVEDIRLILEKEKIEDHVTLVGYSLGCSIANRFAEKYSEKVDKVIMLAPINRTFGEIGERNFVRTLVRSLGKGFFKKWRNYRRLENRWPFYRIFGVFNFRLLQDTYQKIEFTEKCAIVILNGVLDTFFDPEDQKLKMPNIIQDRIGELDHYLFLTTERIQKIAERLIPLLETIRA